MLESMLNYPNSLKFIIQSELDSLRQKYEQVFAESEDENFKLIADEIFERIASLLNDESLSGDPLKTAENLSLAKEILSSFGKQYQEFYSPEFNEKLKRIIIMLEQLKIVLETIQLNNNTINKEDELSRYRNQIGTFHLLANFAKNNWHTLPVETRKTWEIFSENLARKKALNSIKLEELKLQFNSKDTNNLFSSYEKTVNDLIETIQTAASQDEYLQLLKQNQEKINLLDSLEATSDEERKEQEETLKYLKKALNENRVSGRKLFA